MNYPLAFIGIFSKLVYLLPFVNFYILVKRQEPYDNNNIKSRLLIGITVALIGIAIYSVSNLLGMNGVLNENNFSLLDAYVVQFFINIFLLISYLILFFSSYRLLKLKISHRDILTIFVFNMLVIYIITLTVSRPFLILILYTYALEIFFLSSSLIVASFILKRLKVKYYYLLIISAFILIFDLLIFNYIFIYCLVGWSSASCLYSLRGWIHLISGVALLLIFIPNITFYSDLRVRKIIFIGKKDSVTKSIIKKLFNETQKIYGKITFDVYARAFQQCGVKLEETLNLDGLSVAKQKKLLRNIINIMNDVFSPDLTQAIIKKITNKKNKKIISSLIK